MADPHHTNDHAAHGDVFRIYMIVAVVLAICTGMSFLFNQTVHIKLLAFVLILGVAILKAVLVAMYFMHLKWDWKMLYFLIVPVFILGVTMMVVLLPDVVLGAGHDAHEALSIESESTATQR
jgi:cytochrome c oxidase subunit IV